MFVLLSKGPMPEGADDDTADAIEPGVNDTADAIEPGNNNNDTADAINDDDVASVATAGTTGTVGGGSLNGDDENAGEQEKEIDDDGGEEEIDDDGGDFMPDDWMFPGFIAFAMLGPIVPPVMAPYRTEIFMTKLPPIAVGDTSNGRAAVRRMEKNKKIADAKSKIPVKESTAVASAAASIVVKEEHISTQQKIMIAGIAQSKVLIEQRQHFKLNDQKTLLHKEKVTAVRILINAQRFMISILPESDPDRTKAINELKVLNEDLKNALADSISAGEAILNENLAYTQKSTAATAFIDLTVASVLGDDAAPTHTTTSTCNEEGSDSLAVAQQLVVGTPARVATTPQTSNKKAKRYHHSSESVVDPGGGTGSDDDADVDDNCSL